MRTTFAALMLIFALAAPAPSAVDTLTLKHIANISYAAENANPSDAGSMFSPRMDFEQWKPLTGRGDPLRNDPTYDYEPPVLERVHYWGDESRLEREHYPERKSEVLMLGVSSRRPSVASRQPPSPPKRHQRLPPPKYEDFTYKLSEHYPMTILVPPPPPPPGLQPSPFVLSNEKLSILTSQLKPTEPSALETRGTTTTPEHLTSLYALQEANLIYQSSTTSQNWIVDLNQTKPIPDSAVSSDYAGWGPTTPIDEGNVVNETHNIISHDHVDISKPSYSFYKPMLSEGPPPLHPTPSSPLSLTFVPTILPPTVTSQPVTISVAQTTWSPDITMSETTETQDYYDETITEKKTTHMFLPTPIPPSNLQSEKNVFNMLSPMMTMPLVNGPERPEDNLYAHASENLHVYKDKQTEDTVTLETMRPPPLIQSTEYTTTLSHLQPFHVNPHLLNNLLNKPAVHTHDPYFHMRYTTPMPTIASPIDSSDDTKSTTEAPTVPMYLIIQGHSKVKSYSSNPKSVIDNDTINNEITKPNETNEVKHLHSKEKNVKKSENIEINRKGRAQDLKSLVDNGLGSIEIQETDIGIKYDVSDGSGVPIEVYRKGIVETDENDYSRKKLKKRTKRQVDLEDLLPFDEDTLEEYVYNFFKGRRNETGITGLIAQAVTSDAAAAVDDLEESDDDDDR